MWREAFRIVQAHEVWDSYGDFVRSAKPEFGPGIKERIAFAATVTAEQADAARKVMAAARAHVRTLVPPGTGWRCRLPPASPRRSTCRTPR